MCWTLGLEEASTGLCKCVVCSESTGVSGTFQGMEETQNIQKECFNTNSMAAEDESCELMLVLGSGMYGAAQIHRKIRP